MTNYAKYADLVDAVAARQMTESDAKIVASRRDASAANMECEFGRVSAYENRVRFQIGTNMPTKGQGHKTIGARFHGKAAKQARGAGYGNYKFERLYRNPKAL